MNEDWWPVQLAHIPAEDPWIDDHVVVAEVRSFDGRPHVGQRRVFTALVPIDQIEAVKAAFVNMDHDVSASGPHPHYAEDGPYTPRFWVDAKDLPSNGYEPLVLAWMSHDRTVLQPDPGFLMTYGLVPRAVNGGTVYWDDPRAPRHDIVVVTAPSVWKFPLSSHAYVSVSKDYLQDYLSLRHMALVQVFWEIRWDQIDNEIETRLDGQEGLDIDFAAYRLQLGRAMGDRGSIFAQVWGARLVAMPGALPITADPLDDEGLDWPGIDRPVTNRIARGLKAPDYVYVDDSVLAAYEGHQEFRVHPGNGSVTFGTQWSVGFCDRVGRNLIRLETKKLYEGAPTAVVRHWHKFAVAPLPLDAFPGALDEPNIAKRAKNITYAVVEVGEALSGLAKSLNLAISPEEFVGLRRRALDYHGWWTFDVAEAISRHVPFALTVDNFLDRCMALEKLIIEGQSEGNLRKSLQAIGVPAQSIAKLKSLKLLDRVVSLAQIAKATGLTLANDGGVLWERLQKEGTNPPEPIGHLFALHDIRILKAHKVGDRNQRLQDELKRFGIQAGEEAAGYGTVLDRIYDVLLDELTAAVAKIKEVA